MSHAQSRQKPDLAGVGFSDATLHIGSYTATPEQLAQLEGDDVRVEIIR